jgi:DNA-binding response OmpR family regulator
MHILIAEDHPTIRENITLYLETKWHKVESAKDGAVAFDMIQKEKYDFLILDRMMPEIDGLSLVRMLRARSIEIPFLFLTALGKQADKIEWLSLWADDYLVKPFDLEELGLRIENIMRRYQENLSSRKELMPNINIADITLDRDGKRVMRDDRMIELSPLEYALFELLMDHRGSVLTRDFLYESIWWGYEVSEATLDTINVHIAHLRRKIGKDVIRTVKLTWYIIDL